MAKSTNSPTTSHKIAAGYSMRWIAIEASPPDRGAAGGAGELEAAAQRLEERARPALHLCPATAGSSMRPAAGAVGVSPGGTLKATQALAGTARQAVQQADTPVPGSVRSTAAPHALVSPGPWMAGRWRVGRWRGALAWGTGGGGAPLPSKA